MIDRGAVADATARTQHALDSAAACAAPRDARYASPDADLDAMWRALCDIADPELPISLVDLGLVRAVRRRDAHVEVDLTFTASACPCMDFIISDIRERLLRERGVERVTVQPVWDPPWNRAFMTDHGRARLRSFGVSA